MQDGYSTLRPKAFLSWVLLDEQLNLVRDANGIIRDSGSDQVPEETVFNNGGSNPAVYTHIKTNLPVSKNGYLYIYVANETPNLDLFFDNLQVVHKPGPILEETHYYPFGLTMAGISSRAAGKLENKYKFNSGTELNSIFDISIYETKFRSYDPQIGRFLQIDPLANIAFNISTYAYASNDPIFYNDPLGLISTPDNPHVLDEVVVTAKKKGSGGGGFAGFHWPSMRPNQGRWNDEMYSRIRDNRPLVQQGDPTWLKSQTPFHKRNYRADQDYRKMQIAGVGMLASPVAIFGAIEAAPAIATLANNSMAAAVGDAAIKIRAASALADFTVQVANVRDIKSVNVNSVAGSFVFCNPLAGAAFGNIFDARLQNPFVMHEINNPLSASTSSAILLSTTVSVLSSSISGSMNQIFTASPTFNEYLTGLYSNYFSTSIQNKLEDNASFDKK